MIGPDGGQFGSGPTRRLRPAHPLAAQREHYVAQHGHVGEDARLLAEQRHPAPPRPHEAPGAVQDSPAQHDLTVLGVKQAGHHGADRRLARAIGTDECRRAPRLYLQVDDDVTIRQFEGHLQVLAASAVPR